ncbi:acyltransferase [Steroidobacter agaridevorans]|uniref:Acyltransferase n=2 Tax=Steroidobacter agaridevorans TaxID=2695856 RepID=A0A829YJG1_9GAMM|nr:acyltransferase [Steroidobacter agaridevorans]
MEMSVRAAGVAWVRQAASTTLSGLVSSRAAGPDFLRALAILLVMLWHLPRPATPAMLEGLKQYGWTGVDLFFVLSGYLIGTQLLAKVARGQKVNFRDFYLKRALRILPAFLVVLAVYVFLPALRENPTMQAPWRFLTFTMNFGLDYRATGGFTQAWSLCVEEHFYLVFPVLVLLLSRLRWGGWTLVLACGVLLGGMLLRAALWEDAMSAPLADNATASLAPAYLEAIYYPTYCRLDGLLFGALLAAFKAFKPDLWRRYGDPRWTLVAGMVAIALAVLVFHYPATPGFRGPTLTLVGAVFGYPLLALGCACVLAASLEWERAFGAWRVPGAGTIAILSYSIYLTHKLSSHATELLFGKESMNGVGGFALYFVSSIAVGAVLWAAVERPFLLIRDRMLPPARATNT